ncbi:MAG: glyoxalase [Lachnospiraceae bacterium]|nr:glyoxalase [Lachnospiraceae bacterium]
MNEITRDYAEFFLDNQEQLFDFPVAETIEEAMEFLEDCMAQVFESAEEIREYWDETGMSVSEMSDEEILDSLEVFKLPDGKYLVVES